MSAGSGLVTGQRAAPELAHEAVQAALSAAGLARADNVILLLSRDFIRNPQPAVLAAARTAGCLAVCGCTSSGLFTERGWQLDQPAAAALVYTAPSTEAAAESPILSFSGHGRLPFEWQDDAPRAGLLDAEAVTWSNARISDNGCAEFRLPGLRTRLARSCGLRLLGEALPVDCCHGFELGRVGGHRAVDSLFRALPAELRERPPLHQIVALRHADEPGIAILSAGGDGSLMLADTLRNGETITWAIRQPLAAEQDMRQSLNAAASEQHKPDFALMFSCIGRGPLFYGNDDRDLLAFRETFPNTPLLGAYGTGQIIPQGGQNRLFHNTVLTLLFESSHV
jgi:small ligand-binding sensory domain FIST